MTYLHSSLSTEALQEELHRLSHSLKVLEYQIDELQNRYSVFLPVAIQERLRRDERNLFHRLHSKIAQSESTQEELDWREDPDAVIKHYTDAGYYLVYVCGHQEFETEGEALAEACFLHTLNEARRCLGADGSYIEDMLDPVDMIYASFVIITAKEYAAQQTAQTLHV